MQTQNPIHSPLYAAGWGIIAMLFAPLALGLVFLTDKVATNGGSQWGIAWLLCAAATVGIGTIAVRELAARVAGTQR